MLRTRYIQCMAEMVVVVDPEILSGTPCFRGTRVPFRNLIDYLESGQSLPEFLEDFPTVSRELAIQALEEAKDSLGARPRNKIGDRSGEKGKGAYRIRQ